MSRKLGHPRENRRACPCIVGIRVLNGYYVQLAPVPANSECTVFLGHNHAACRPFYPAWFNNIHRQHLVVFLFLKFLAWGPAFYDAEWMGRSPAKSNSVSCLAGLFQPKYPSHLCWNPESRFKYLARIPIVIVHFFFGSLIDSSMFCFCMCFWY